MPRFRSLFLGALALTAAAPRLHAQRDSLRLDAATIQENAVKRQRAGAGLRVGTWATTGLPEVTGASYSTLPFLEGYWQKGMDKHLVMETSGGFWGRTQRDSNGRVSSYAVPMLTALKLYPATVPGDELEPFFSVAGGVTIGVDDENGTTGGLFSGGSSGTNLIIGLGLKGGGGIEYHVGRAFGLQAGASYQWIHFLNPIGGTQDYKGPVLFGGLTYRFQY